MYVVGIAIRAHLLYNAVEKDISMKYIPVIGQLKCIWVSGSLDRPHTCTSGHLRTLSAFTLPGSEGSQKYVLGQKKR